jgi:hypothetical protein
MSKIYKQEDCLINQNKDELFSNGLYTQKNNKWQISNHPYCLYCNDVYHNICKNCNKKINSRIFPGVDDSECSDINTIQIKNECNQINKKLNKNLTDNEIINYKKNTKMLYNKLKQCFDYRSMHHKNCMRYRGDDTSEKLIETYNRGDKGHKTFLDNLEEAYNSCNTTYINAKSIKPLRSHKYLSKEDSKIKYNSKKYNKHYIKSFSFKNKKYKNSKKKSKKIKKKSKKNK